MAQSVWLAWMDSLQFSKSNMILALPRLNPSLIPRGLQNKTEWHQSPSPAKTLFPFRSPMRGSIFCKCAPCRLDLTLCLVPLWKGCILQKTGHALWRLPGGLISRHVVVYALTGLFSFINTKVIQEELTFWTEAIRLLARGWSWVSVVPIH